MIKNIPICLHMCVCMHDVLLFVPSGVSADLLVAPEGRRCCAAWEEPSPPLTLCVWKIYQSPSPEMHTDTWQTDSFLTDSHIYMYIYIYIYIFFFLNLLRASIRFVYCRTSILRLMCWSSLGSGRIQLNWSPNKGSQLPFTTRVRHSCSIVQRTGVTPSF